MARAASESDFFLTLTRLQKDVGSEANSSSDAGEVSPGGALGARRSRHRADERACWPWATPSRPRHGDPEGHVHARKFTVVGILKPSGTPNDRAVFVNMEGFYLMEDHAKPLEKPQPKTEQPEPKLSEEEWKAERSAAEAEAASKIERAADPDPLPVEQREVTAILLKVDPMFAPGIENGINEGKQAQAVLPVAVIYGLFEFIVNPIQWTLLLLTAMICIVSRHQHSGEHLQLDERAARRDRRDAGPRRRPRHRDDDHPARSDAAGPRRRRCSAGCWATSAAWPPAPGSRSRPACQSAS